MSPAPRVFMIDTSSLRARVHVQLPSSITPALMYRPSIDSVTSFVQYFSDQACSYPRLTPVLWRTIVKRAVFNARLPINDKARTRPPQMINYGQLASFAVSIPCVAFHR
jgi:hypothetical protein